MYSLTAYLLNTCWVPVSSPIYSGDKTDPVSDLGTVSLAGSISCHQWRQDWNSGEWSLEVGHPGWRWRHRAQIFVMEFLREQRSHHC